MPACADIAVPGTVLQVTQRIPAGAVGTEVLAGTAARIFTGAPIPPGADAVVMQEDCEAVAGSSEMRVLSVPTPGQWIRRSGEDVRAAPPCWPPGERLDPQALGLAASVGRPKSPVRRRPACGAVFDRRRTRHARPRWLPRTCRPVPSTTPTGSSCAACLQRLGCTVTDLGIVPDQRAATIEALRDAAQHHDLVLTSGGVSVGEEDHIKPAVAELGRLDLWQIAIKPGKPFAYGRIDAAHFMGLPGNPVSSFVTFLMLVRPFLLALQGATEPGAVREPMRADFSWPRADRRREFLRVRRNAQGGLDLFPNQSSGVLTSGLGGRAGRQPAGLHGGRR
jgi:molybdopterin molybdotransferase